VKTMANKESLLPNGPEASGDDDFDLADLRVNFSEEEASSEGRSFEAIPGGKYHVAITKVEVRRVKDNAKGNQGKPFWNLTLNIQGDSHPTYADRKVFGSVMLFEGALYSFAQLMKATGHEDVVTKGSPNFGKVPPADDLLGEQFIAIVAKKRDTYKEKELGDGEKLFKNEVTGYKALNEGAVGHNAAAGGSLMP